MADKQDDTGGEELDVAALDKSKIAQLMKRDPKFISRLITDLDKSMHKMLDEREKRRQTVDADLADIKKINDEINTHIQPNLTRLTTELQEKERLREQLKAQIAAQSTTFSKLERDAAALIRKATHSSRGITLQTVSRVAGNADAAMVK